MKNIIFKLQFVLIFTGLLCINVSADTFYVKDQHGKPVQNAVLEFTGFTKSAAIKNKTAVMDQINKRFVPDVLVVKANDRVNFPNSDNIRHHVYSFSEAKPFELKLYTGQPKEPLLFDKSGIVVLGCNIHDSMLGYIYVAKSDYALITDVNGMATIDKDLRYENVLVWHPDQTKGHLLINNIPKNKLHRTNDNIKNEYLITLSIQPPEPRDTFKDYYDDQ